ncbi:ABC transporter ATP-binding protein [Clostridium carboxidivorans P7]|uniref:ABC transporter related protein n=1 Tax=Clostridium carboxidivorans P7 TaxID=536227 RepID=C6PS95_9CLOT|nr:ATP-binding cassette domain-containing protein [Clostridium carboxidivorans]AKN33398.1 ABC transporter ATP-binding protein [Clostridium carboxidivorans P7]EET87892.1 ABC transporter related protein [Clostridium carboxidivorans P7]EFG89225.1 putative bacitracin transport ATP-binding protein BcrA [Clostridium carboxidivorans P7]
MSDKWIVETDKLRKVFDGVEVIKDCSMHIKQGTIYGFLGMNGAGKTTVFKMLSSLLSPTSGTAKVLGIDITSHSSEVLRNIGSIIEVPIFYEHLSAAENLQVHLGYMNKKNIDIDKTLETVGLPSRDMKPVSTFSLGMRQRLGIARTIIHQPKLLILDEPLNGLDPMGILEMRDLFLNLVRNEGMTILISSHILNDIEHIADSIGIIANGKIIDEVGMAKIKSKTLNSSLEEYFFEKIKEKLEYD